MSPVLSDGPRLVVVPNVGLAVEGDRFLLDIKATEGLKLYADLWPGPVTLVGRTVPAGSFGYGAWYAKEDLPFDVLPVSRDADAAEIAPHCAGAALVLGGADSHFDLGLVNALPGTAVALIIEYTLKTRLDMLRLERRGAISKLKTALWLLRTERPRRRALTKAAAIQANGTPAYRSYSRKERDDLLYFDTRLTRALAITSAEAEAKAAAVAQGSTMRLAFSGRLERIKGADHLIPVLAALHRLGVPQATLDIYGDGSLCSEIAKTAAAAGLSGAVRLHGPVPFERALVPALKASVDLFVCCHPQADPSCTYFETLGCGVPIAGYRNQAFEGVLDCGDIGVGMPIGDVEGLARAIAVLARDRDRLATLTRNAARIAGANLFEDVFGARIAHLRRVAGV